MQRGILIRLIDFTVGGLTRVIQGRSLTGTGVRLIQSESENSLRNRISSDLRKKSGRSF
eukprot:COSAG02_NODE_32078_length_522_cov_1.458629_1_plen_58_part_01